MPRKEDAAAESDISNATLCGNCSKALQKPLVCARCQTATYCSKNCQVTENGGCACNGDVTLVPGVGRRGARTRRCSPAAAAV